MVDSKWNSTLYEGKHSFVWEYGEDLLQLLLPQPGERILDVGCGTGQLTQALAEKGVRAIGIDRSSRMIEQARANFPHLEFQVADATDFALPIGVDGVFSNAVLHWVPQAEAVICCIDQVLKPGGRLVVELGAKGNVAQILAAIAVGLESLGRSRPHPWYFPRLGEYTSLLEKQGFWVNYATTFERLTPLTDGEQGLEHWLKMFTQEWLEDLSESEITQLFQQVESQLKPRLYDGSNWFADYRRLRIMATKA
jgi:trans-aconitate 2-methyltransferase